MDQLLPQSKFKGEDEQWFEERKSKYVKLFEQARQARIVIIKHTKTPSYITKSGSTHDDIIQHGLAHENPF